MSTEQQPEIIAPPRFTQALRTGFDTVANHIELILLPILLDLFLWLGPHLQLRQLLSGLILQMSELEKQAGGEVAEVVSTSQEAWTELAQSFNLLSFLRTFPVGVPSLMSGVRPISTPFGQPVTLDIPSFWDVLGIGLLTAVVGLILGSLYFSAVARAVSSDPGAPGLRRTTWTALQTILLSLAWVGLLLAIYLPASCLIMVLFLISPGLASFVALLFSVVIVWLFLPLIFSPHGIYVYRQNALASMLTSLRLVRFILPGTGMFFLSILILSQGLNLLWAAPEPSSWMSLVGIAGHAFITTALTASSFVYYLEAVHWVREYLHKNVLGNSVGTQAA